MRLCLYSTSRVYNAACAYFLRYLLYERYIQHMLTMALVEIIVQLVHTPFLPTNQWGPTFWCLTGPCARRSFATTVPRLHESRQKDMVPSTPRWGLRSTSKFGREKRHFDWLVMHISQFSDFFVDKIDKVILSGPSTLIPWSVSWLAPQMIDAQAMQQQSFSRPSPKARFGWGIGGVLVSKWEHQHRCGMMWESFCFDSNKSKWVPDNFVRLQFFDPTRPHFCVAIGLGFKIELLPISISQW